ncbi:MAG: hypothetical protein EZS28_044583, partial [Streblomastix strix]
GRCNQPKVFRQLSQESMMCFSGIAQVHVILRTKDPL